MELIEKIKLFFEHAEVSGVDIEMAAVLVISVGVAFVAITMQFITVLRHKGEHAVVDSFTWLLLAGFAAAVGAFVWQKHSDFFLTLTLEILASGAIAGFVLNLRNQAMLAEVQKMRKAPKADFVEHQNKAIDIREKLRAAREAKGRPVE